MAVLNRVINILILLAAIAAVVFSYLLFSKREELVNGWEQMATAINTAAATLDDGGTSGTSAASDLAMEKMKHTNYEQLGQTLPKLRENTSKVVTQRNELADALRNAASTLSIAAVKAPALKNIASYKDQNRIFQQEVQEFRNVRDGVSSGYANTVRKAGGSISASELNNAATYRSAIAKADTAVDELVTRKNVYADYLGRFAAAFSVPAPRTSGAAYQTELSKSLSALKAKNSEFVETRNTLATLKDRVKQLDAIVRANNQTIESKNSDIAKFKKQIVELHRILDKDGTLKLPPHLLTGVELECYRYVKGKIEYVDKNFGFVTINVGKHFNFTQQYGIKKNQVLFPLTPGKVMTVARSLNSAEPVFVGKILITKVDDNSAIGNLLLGRPDQYHVGDLVYFSDDDIAAIRKKENATAKN